MFVTSTHLAPNELVIHLFVAILLLEPFEGRGVVAEHTLKVDEVHFSHADAPLLGLQTFRAQQTSRPTSTRTVLTGVLRRKSHAVCRMLGYLIIKNELVAMFFCFFLG